MQCVTTILVTASPPEFLVNPSKLLGDSGVLVETPDNSIGICGSTQDVLRYAYAIIKAVETHVTEVTATRITEEVTQ